MNKRIVLIFIFLLEDCNSSPICQPENKVEVLVEYAMYYTYGSMLHPMKGSFLANSQLKSKGHHPEMCSAGD